jgi:hypothetical protein
VPDLGGLESTTIIRKESTSIEENAEHNRTVSDKQNYKDLYGKEKGINFQIKNIKDRQQTRSLRMQRKAGLSLLSRSQIIEENCDDKKGLDKLKDHEKTDSSIQYHSPETDSDGEHRNTTKQVNLTDTAALPEIDQIIINLLDLVSCGDHEAL